MNVKPIKTRIFKEGENLEAFIADYIKKIHERSILVIASKIVALSEKRTVPGGNLRAKIALIKKESETAMRTKYVWLTVKDDMVMANAGIDESNANGKLILLPKDSFACTESLRNALRGKFKLKHLGVLITDSRTMPLRAGITGVALGYAGFRGVKNYRGTPDIFGRKFEFSSVDVADSLAAAAVLTMGEGKERQPLAIIESAPVEFSHNVRRKELHIDMKEDMYRPFFENMTKSKQRRNN